MPVSCNREMHSNPPGDLAEPGQDQAPLKPARRAPVIESKGRTPLPPPAQVFVQRTRPPPHPAPPRLPAHLGPAPRRGGSGRQGANKQQHPALPYALAEPAVLVPGSRPTVSVARRGPSSPKGSQAAQPPTSASPRDGQRAGGQKAESPTLTRLQCRETRLCTTTAHI